MVLAGGPDPSPWPTDGSEGCVHAAECAPHSFSVCAQPRKEAIFIPTANSAALKGQ